MAKRGCVSKRPSIFLKVLPVIRCSMKLDKDIEKLSGIKFMQ